MVVAKVATGTGNRATGSSASLSVTATSPNLASTGADVCAIIGVQVSVSTNSTSTTIASVTYGGTAATQIGTILLGGSSTARAGVALFRLFNPPTGTQNVVATAGGASTKDAISAQVIVFSGVGSIGSLQTATATTHAPTSTVGGYDVRVLSNGAALSGPNQTDEYGAGSTVTGVGDYVRVQSAAGTGSTISFTCAGTATTALSAAVEITPPNPKTATVTDDFSATNPNCDYAGGAAVSGGQAVIPCATSYPSITYDGVYDLEGSTHTVEAVGVPAVGNGGTEMYFSAAVGTNSVEIILLSDGIYFWEKAAGTSNSTHITYDPVAHRWWRFGESAGTLYWWTSPTGADGSWTERRSKTKAIAVPLNAVTLGLSCGYYGTETAPGSATFDNLNLPPSGGGAAPVVVRNTWTALQRANLW